MIFYISGKKKFILVNMQIYNFAREFLRKKKFNQVVMIKIYIKKIDGFNYKDGSYDLNKICLLKLVEFILLKFIFLS